MNTLIEIQNELKAPKNAYNSFGGYKYRSAEMILESVKPILKKHGCLLTLSDDLVSIDGRFYIKAIATLKTQNDTFTVTAYAREEETKKGMDGSQITGTASSYARKYALNGLFLIDDTKDADTDEYQHTVQNEKAKRQTKGMTKKEREELINRIDKCADEKHIAVAELCASAGVGSLEDLPDDRLNKCMDYVAKQ